MGSHKMVGKGYVTLKNAKWYPLVPFHLHMSHTAANSMATFISQLCGELQLVVCWLRGDRIIKRSSKHLWTSDKPQKQATSKVS